MKTVKVSKDELIKKITENRDSHKKLLEEALEGYQKLAVKKLESKIRAVKAGKKVRSITFDIPQDYSKDYDRALKMLEMSVDKEIELDQNEFRQYVMDEWGWKQQFLMSYASNNVNPMAGSLNEDDEED